MATADKHVILLVDDEEAITRSSRRLFRKEGYLILSAASGTAGLQMLRRLEYPVSLIISDQRMPEMSGAEFLARSREKAPDAIRFLLTGYSDMNAVIEAVNKGEIHRYLTKPWNDSELVTHVRQALSQVDLIRENKRLNSLTKKQNEELKRFNEELEKRVAQRTEEVSAKNIELEAHLKNTVRVLSSLVETMNPGLGRYMQRTARLARQVGAEFGLATPVLDQIEIAGLVHDIGLLGFSDDVLHINEDRLKGEDLKRFSQHPVIAAISFEALDSLSEVGEIILHHHEWVNGNGFPNGLKKKNIPFGSRILGATSTYCRIVETWPKEKKVMLRLARGFLDGSRLQEIHLGSDQDMLHEIAQEILIASANRKYDAQVVDKLFKVLGDPTKVADHRKTSTVPVEDLCPGMILEQNLKLKDGRLLLPWGAPLKNSSINALRQLAERRLIEKAIRISQ